MKKMRKGKKLLLILLVLIVVIIAAVLIIKNVVEKMPPQEEPEEPEIIIGLPETTYSDMEVRNIELEYLRDNNETMVSFEIHNTTAAKVEHEDLYAILVGPDDNMLGKLQTYIEGLDVGEQYDISVVYKGDLTATKQIKLEKKVNE